MNERAQATFGGSSYVVKPGDVLKVRIWGWPEPATELEGTFPVESSGVAHLPVIGAMQVAGKTAEEVQREFRTRFAEEQRNPVVTISPAFAISVMGEVRNPGVIDVFPGYTVFDALTTADGFQEQANRSAVLLVRGGTTRTLSGGNAEETAALLAQTPLESGDRIIVQRARSAGVVTINTVLQAVLSAATLIVLIAK